MTANSELTCILAIWILPSSKGEHCSMDSKNICSLAGASSLCSCSNSSLKISLGLKIGLTVSIGWTRVGNGFTLFLIGEVCPGLKELTLTSGGLTRGKGLGSVYLTLIREDGGGAELSMPHHCFNSCTSVSNSFMGNKSFILWPPAIFLDTGDKFTNRESTLQEVWWTHWWFYAKTFTKQRRKKELYSLVIHQWWKIFKLLPNTGTQEKRKYSKHWLHRGGFTLLIALSTRSSEYSASSRIVSVWSYTHPPYFLSM